VASGRDEHQDEGRAEAFVTSGDAGWWVFCNDRLLLFAERSKLTGWGDGAPAYHPQYRHFRGYVYLTSANSELLPWNTTKTGVDQDSRIWRRVQSAMKTALADVVALINRLKNEKLSASDDDDMPALRAAQQTSLTKLAELPTTARVIVPAVRQVHRRPAGSPARTVSVQYSIDREKYRAVAEVLGAGSAAEAGRSTFEYFYDREVDD